MSFESLAEALAASERAGLRRPWELVYDPASAFRVLDADSRLVVRFGADPEQALTVEDMAMIVEAVNAL